MHGSDQRKRGKNLKKLPEKMWEKKNSCKGFTLVELIVVLVILALLAAFMIPSMVGWIDKAKNREVLLEGRTLYLAAQTLASEDYGETSSDTEKTLVGDDLEAVKALAGIDVTDDNISIKIAGGKVTEFSYTKGNHTVTCDGKQWKTDGKETK